MANHPPTSDVEEERIESFFPDNQSTEYEPTRLDKNLTTYLVEATKNPALNLSELWANREVLYILVWRDVKVRYKQTVIGAAWAIIQPLFTMVIFSFAFGQIAKISSDGIPYPIFSFTALVPWTFFANGMGLASNSLVSQGGIIRKIYFPRLIVPLSAIFGCGIDFAIAFLVLLVMNVKFNFLPTGQTIWLLPILLLLLLATTVGTGLWFSAINVRYRDVRYIIPFVVQGWMFLTPIIYPASLLSPDIRLLSSLNPLTSVIEGFRLALLGVGDLTPPMLIISIGVALIILVTGVFYFHHIEGFFADVI